MRDEARTIDETASVLKAQALVSTPFMSAASPAPTIALLSGTTGLAHLADEPSAPGFKEAR